MKHIFISFATDNYLHHAQRLCQSARANGFDEAYIYTPSDLDDNFNHRCSNILSCQKGAGYWLWKSYVILKALCEKCIDGDILVYCDSQYVFIEDMRDFLRQEILKSTAGIAISNNKPNEPSFPEHQWTKGDAFMLISGKHQAEDDSLQAWAGFIALKRSHISIGFVGAWLGYAEDARNVTDIPSYIISNHHSFVENRHDQTVLSLIAKRYNIKFFHFPCRYLQNIRVPFNM